MSEDKAVEGKRTAMSADCGASASEQIAHFNRKAGNYKRLLTLKMKIALAPNAPSLF